MLTLIRAGLYTSVQDAGRFGLRQSGVSYCGALDRPSLEIANLLVGNAGSTAALEITLGQCVIEFGQETWFALTGAGCDATLDGKAVWTGWRLTASDAQASSARRAQLSCGGGRYRRAGGAGLIQHRPESGNGRT